MAQLQFRDLMPTGPATPAGKYLRKFWQPIFVSQKLEKGRAKSVKVMNEAFTLYRGASGQPYLVQSRCPHRGVQLSAGWVEDDCIRCMYHGWQFDGHGNCTEQPAETEDYKDNVKIKAYPVEDYLGLIFAFLGQEEPPPLPRYRSFEEEGIMTAKAYARSSNYLHALDNHSDDVHIVFTHRDTVFSRVGISLVPTMEGKENEYGMTVVARFPNGNSRASQLLMPNGFMFKSQPDNGEEEGFVDRCIWRVPIDDHSHLCISTELRPGRGAAQKIRGAVLDQKLAATHDGSTEDVARQILNGDRRLSDPDVLARPDLITIQDSVAQLGQPQIDDPFPEYLGRSDRGIIQFRRIWLREVQAMEEGKPLKQWIAPSHSTISTGTES